MLRFGGVAAVVVMMMAGVTEAGEVRSYYVWQGAPGHSATGDASYVTAIDRVPTGGLVLTDIAIVPAGRVSLLLYVEERLDGSTQWERRACFWGSGRTLHYSFASGIPLTEGSKVRVTQLGTLGGSHFTLTGYIPDSSRSVPALSCLDAILVGFAAVGGVVFGRSKRGVVSA